MYDVKALSITTYMYMTSTTQYCVHVSYMTSIDRVVAVITHVLLGMYATVDKTITMVT